MLKYRIMSNKEVKVFSDKLRQGLMIAERIMLEEKALHNEDLIVSSDGETFQRISAKEIIENTTKTNNVVCEQDRRYGQR